MQEQTTIEKTELKIPTTLKALIEALIFAAHEPLSINQIKSIYQDDFLKSESLRQIESETIKQIVSDLNKEYEKFDRPYRIIQIAGGYQFATVSAYAEWLGRLHKEQGRRKLSQSGIETLAIVAYKQPITKSEIENIRGVNCDYVLKTLLEKELVTVTGRAESVGRPLLYGTTREFLKHFGLNDVTDLPRPREIEEILGESQFETERRMLEAQAGAEKIKKEQEEFKSRLPHIPKKKPELEDKDVEIIQRKKNKEIRIVKIEEQKTLEETGQEKIEFKQEIEDKKELNKYETVEEAKKDIAEIIVEEQKIEDQSEIVLKQDTNQAETVSSEPHEQETIEAKADESSLQEIVENIETISAEETIKEQEQDYTSAPDNLQKPKRWQVWKEKIRVFIKKLFV